MKYLVLGFVGFWVLTLLSLLVVLGGALHHLVTSTGAYRQAIAIARASPELQRKLGDKFKVQVPVLGFAEHRHGAQFVVFSAKLVGSQSSGHLQGIANEIHGTWEFSRLSFVPDRNGKRIDLTPTAPSLKLPDVPAKKVYLIPIGWNSAEPLDWAPPFYRAKLGIELEVLPALLLPEKVQDVRRRQVDSDALIEYLRGSYPQLARQPSNILVAVTSYDIFIRNYGWQYAENLRSYGRYAVVSSARFHPPLFLDSWNPEWLNSRFQKMLTKNLAILYYDLPMSSDYTSLLSGGVLSGPEVDLMSGSIIGAEGQWDPFIDNTVVGTAVFAAPGKPAIWRMVPSWESPPQKNLYVFDSVLTTNLFDYRKTDFRFDGDYPLQLTRVYNSLDDQARPMGLGTNDSLDIFLVGQMGSYVELIFEDGTRVHFTHVPFAPGQKGDTYQAALDSANGCSGARIFYSGNGWTAEKLDGWKYYFPYRPDFPGMYVTILTGLADPSGKKYEMIRNASGELLSVTTPAGQWLHLERDARHHVQSVSDSSGRRVDYSYDEAGRLIYTRDSEGNEEHYTYNERNQLLSASLGVSTPLLVNTYDVMGNLRSQTLPDGRQFTYHYIRDPNGRGNSVLPDFVTAPNGMFTCIEYFQNGYAQSLPTFPPLPCTPYNAHDVKQ